MVERIEAAEIDIVFNTVEQEPKAARDSFAIRGAALQQGIAYFRTFGALRALACAVHATRDGTIGVRPIQNIHRAQ